MESKSVILSVLLMSLVMAQIGVEAKSCCPSTTARNVYNSCRFAGGSRPTCASLSGCKIVDGTTCPSGYDKLTLQTDTDGIMTLATEVNEASEAQKLLIRIAEEQQKIGEFYSQISAAMKSSNYDAPQRSLQQCLPPGMPCIGWQGGNCCSNKCNFFVPITPVGICG